MQALILAGGLGTRLKSISGDLPKPLVPIAGRSMLDRQLEQLSNHGCSDILVLTGYAGNQIADFCRTRGTASFRIRCLQETTPRGTAGAALDAWKELDEQFFVLYGDTVLSVDLERMAAWHRRQEAGITLLVHPSDHPEDSDLVEVAGNGRVQAFHPYPRSIEASVGVLTNAGVYLIEKSALAPVVESAALPARPDFIRHIFPFLLASGIPVFAYRSPEYIKDAGTPLRFAKVEADLIEDRIEPATLCFRAPGVLLDRDGTLIEERGHLSNPDQVQLIPQAAAAIAALNRASFRTAIVTNQPVIARGECDEAGMQQIHNRLETLLSRGHAHVDRIYYCPHHPDSGFPGERTDLKVSCSCRKPALGMVKEAMDDLNLAPEKSWLIGDSTTDIATARRAGMRSILVKTGLAGRDGKWPVLADYECRDLQDAVDLILHRWPNLYRQLRPRHFKALPRSVFLVGGLARSGKSTVASVLSEVFREDGLSAIIVPLDCFLKGKDQNRGATVLNRYDVRTALEFLQDALCNPGPRLLPRYDRVLRQSIPDSIEIDIPPNPLLILEGVPALAYPELRGIAADSIYVARPEDDRLQELALDYRWRGWQEPHISELFASRAIDEAPLIESSRPYAGTVLSPATL